MQQTQTTSSNTIDNKNRVVIKQPVGGVGKKPALMLTIESDDENEESEVDDEEEKKEESKDSGIDD